MSGWYADFKDWLSQPFSADMTAAQWFYFVGLFIVILTLWGLILNHIKRAAA